MTTLKAQRAAEVLANRQQAYSKKLATLTGHVMGRIPADEIRAAFDAGRSADDFAAEIAAREPVGKALHEQKAEAVKSAAMDAAAVVGKLQAELEAAGWDIEVVAPYPAHNDYSGYKSKMARRNLFGSVTESEEGYRSPRRGEPQIVRMNPKGIDRFITHAEQDAALQYDSFICKLVRKIGAGAVDATIRGDHVWSYSILSVTMTDGSVQRWKTQQIFNYSVHGLRFPQWPSRKVK